MIFNKKKSPARKKSIAKVLFSFGIEFKQKQTKTNKKKNNYANDKSEKKVFTD